MITINGKDYPLWSHFIENADEWIGGTLQELADMEPCPAQSGSSIVVVVPMATEIVNVVLEENGKEDALFCVHGRDFDCAGSTKYLGITAGENGWITLMGYGGHTWRIKKRETGIN